MFALISCSNENSNSPGKDDPPAFSGKENNFIPAGITVTTTDGVAELSWPEFPGATAYQLYWSSSPVIDTKTADTITLDTPFYSHENIKNDVNFYYTYTVVINGVEGVASNEVAVTPQVPPVGTPANLKIIPGHERLTLTWSVENSDLSKANPLYHVYWNTSGNVTTDDEKLVATTSLAVHLGLQNGQQYYYRIATVIDNMEGSLSNEVSSAPHIPPLLAPLNVAVTADVSENLIEWQAVEFANSYSVYWNTSGNVGLSDQFFEVSEPMFNHKDLRNGNTYFYRVMAHGSSFNSSFSREVSARPATALPDTPQRISVIAGVEKTTITWSAVQDASLYNLYWYTDGTVTNVNPNVTSPFIHNDLSPNVEVSYRIAAVVDGVEGLPSAQVTVTPLPQPAAAPAGVAVTHTQSQQGVLLAWEPNEAAIVYNLYWNTTGDVTTEDEVIKNVTSPYAHLEAENGNTYYYIITFANNEGESLPSNVIKVTLVPNAPNDIKAETNDNSVTLQWDEIAGAKNYHLYWSASPGVDLEERNHISNVDPGYIHTDLTYGQTYHYLITSENEAGESISSKELVVAIDDEITISAPSNVFVMEGNEENIITWSEVTGATSYSIFWSVNNAELDNKLENVTSGYIHNNLTNDVKYNYLVIASNELLTSDASQIVSATPMPPVPGTPAELTLTPDINSVSLSWGDVEFASSYKIYWSTSQAIPLANMEVINVNATSFVHESLNSDTDYYYRVSTVNLSGESIPSIERTVKTLAPVPLTPADISVSVAGSDLVLNWSKVPYALSYKIYRSSNPIISTEGLDAILVDTPQYIHHSPVIKQTFYYRISSVGSTGESATSEQVTGVIEDKLISDVLELIPDQTFRNCIALMASENQWSNVSEASSLVCSSDEGGFIQSLDGIHQFLFITELSFFGNQIQNLDAFSGHLFPALTRILLANNGIENIDGLGGIIAPNLYYLNLDQNNISDLNALSSLTSLIDLSVSQNQVVDVSPLSNLTALHKLDLHNNKVGGVNIGNLDSLLPLTSNNVFEYFDISQNINIDCAELEAILHSLGGVDKIPDSPINESNCTITKDSIPLSPKNVITRAGADFVQFLWDESLGATSYTVYWSNEPIGSGGMVFEFPEVTHDFVHQQLLSGLSHYYQISASNVNGESIRTSEISLTPQPVLLSELVELDPGFQNCVNEMIDTGQWMYAHEVDELNCSSRESAIENLTGVHHFSGVSRMDFSGNNLSDLNGFEFSYFPNLSYLNLYWNYISSAEGLLTAHMPSIIELIFGSNNQLLSAKPINTLTTLQKLYFEWMVWVDLNDLPDLINLTDLGFSSMSNQGDPLNIDAIKNYSKLERLDLSFNLVQDYSSLAAIDSLTYVNLMGNNIGDLSLIPILNSVTHLDVSNNSINNVSPLANMTQLQDLNLSSNQISDVTPLTALAQLQKLDLSYNWIADAAQFSNMSQLQYLTLTFNRIEDVRPFSALTQMLRLGLFDNRIGFNPNGNVIHLKDLTSAEEIELGFNPNMDCWELSELRSFLGEDVVVHKSSFSHVEIGCTNYTQ